jgi:hypothetical protein
MAICDNLQTWVYVRSLGSTRFLKVARARHKTAASDASHSSQLVVVKVFTAQDLGLNLRTYRDHLLEVKRGLEGCLNCLPFQRVFVSPINKARRCPTN